MEQQINLPKIIVLCMTCNNSEFKGNEEAIRNTWAKPIIDNKITNMEFYFFKGGKQNRINNKNNTITVNCEDTVDYTFEKTQACIKLLLSKGIYFDYIVRVNTSTYVNAVYLNNYIFYNSIYNHDKNYVLCQGVAKSKNNEVFPIGKILVFNRYNVNKILSYKNEKHVADDVIYGDVFNDNIDINNIKTFSKEYRSIGYPIYYNWIEDFYFDVKTYYKNTIQKPISDIYSIDVLKNHVFMSVRDVTNNRENEIKSFYNIYNVLNNYNNNFEDFVYIYFSDLNLIIDKDNKISVDRTVEVQQ